jgi:hypothetical protein
MNMANPPGKTDKEKKAKSAKKDLVKSAREALAMKKASGNDGNTQPESRTEHDGMRPIPNTGIAPSGALEQEGHRPVLERSRKVR